MVEKDIFFTPEGLEKIENEIEYLKTVRRKEVAERIKIALGYGDLSENSEYDEAKNEQAQVEERIAKLEMMVRNAKVIDGDALNTDKVNIGSMVKVLDVKTKKETVFNIVGSAEADPLKGKISNESPVGAKLIGKEIGDIVEIEVPKGTITYKIEDISL
ncbi:transcription elongation factor GreA [Peptoniphilus koenoeneniae]|uniref:Transcription elongation factor GreA n=1 Tax=Peptoniphilus koenoeneniae TaxID=507751 RepID=A0ABU0AWP7_9FIRM|nr:MULTISPECIES: transcription elongation factor GreA [Peptoniphilus]ERT56247.1 transcription elongation factor GreA/GreB C-terminal domain protein [Peptoniphilus sp. BV3C26]MDQ0275241.1 transcription elongation factor GreA [Peptoniphilus koenoeneniae]